tara:strand:- start:5217 stop:5462 length:246 start_codon:yes stop_codon:yes gene_type:complete
MKVVKTQKMPAVLQEKGLKAYPKGAEVTNPYSGNSIQLNGLELSIYDLLIGCERYQMWDEFYVCRDWFMKNNIDAYMALID